MQELSAQSHALDLTNTDTPRQASKMLAQKRQIGRAHV